MLKRSEGDSAVAAAAYRAGMDLRDERRGEVHRYTPRGGVEATELLLPDEAPDLDREELWNRAEERERRSDSQVAREFMVALPHELSDGAREELARDLARHLVKRYGVAADVAIHDPAGREGRNGEPQDARNHHVHILTTRRRWESGELTDTITALNPYRGDGQAELEELHRWWEDRQQAAVRQHRQAQEERRAVLRDSPNRPRPPRDRDRAAPGLRQRAAEMLDNAPARGARDEPSPPTSDPAERSEADSRERSDRRGGQSI